MIKLKSIFHKIGLVVTAIITLIVSGGIAASMYVGTQKLPVREYFSPAYANSVWDWSNILTRNEANITSDAQWLTKHQFNTVYVDVSAISSGETPEKMDTALASYVSTMRKYNIQVFASGGDRYWSKPDNRKYPVALMDYVHSYNLRYPNERVNGIEYDIESYNQEGFPDASFDQKEVVLTELLDTVDTLANRQESYLKEHPSVQLELGFSVPYWFDNENKNIKSISWMGKTGPTIFHIMDRLNKLSKSNVVVMAYRNASRGNDGTIAHARNEIEYAQYKASNVKVIIGQEVTNVEPAKITFYGQSLIELSREVDWIKQEYTKSGVLGGLAVNDLEGLTVLPDK